MQVMTRTDKDHHLQAHGPSNLTFADMINEIQLPMYENGVDIALQDKADQEF